MMSKLEHVRTQHLPGFQKARLAVFFQIACQKQRMPLVLQSQDQRCAVLGDPFVYWWPQHGQAISASRRRVRPLPQAADLDAFGSKPFELRGDTLVPKGRTGRDNLAHRDGSHQGQQAARMVLVGVGDEHSVQVTDSTSQQALNEPTRPHGISLPTGVHQETAAIRTSDEDGIALSCRKERHGQTVRAGME